MNKLKKGIWKEESNGCNEMMGGGAEAMSILGLAMSKNKSKILTTKKKKNEFPSAFRAGAGAGAGGAVFTYRVLSTLNK